MSALAGVSAAGSVISGVMKSVAARAQAKQFRRIGDVEVEDQRRANRRVIGAQTATFGASGVSATTGSALDVLADSVSEGELIALRKKFERESQASAKEAEADSAFLSGLTGAGSSILGSASG